MVGHHGLCRYDGVMARRLKQSQNAAQSRIIGPFEPRRMFLENNIADILTQ